MGFTQKLSINCNCQKQYIILVHFNQFYLNQYYSKVDVYPKSIYKFNSYLALKNFPLSIHSLFIFIIDKLKCLNHFDSSISFYFPSDCSYSLCLSSLCSSSLCSSSLCSSIFNIPLRSSFLQCSYCKFLFSFQTEIVHGFVVCEFVHHVVRTVQGVGGQFCKKSNVWQNLSQPHKAPLSNEEGGISRFRLSIKLIFNFDLLQKSA
ncbi:hypothetical protein pb186bvf_019674 [Paramecium bursaria]